MKICARPLTPDLFAPFGRAISLRSGGIGRVNCDDMLVNLRAAAQPRMAVATIEASTAPFAIRQTERHLHSSQTFVPTNISRYLVVVWPSDSNGDPKHQEVRAFVASGDHIVSYAPGTWHHAMTLLDRAGQYLVIRWDDGSDGDVEFRELPYAVHVATS